MGIIIDKPNLFREALLNKINLFTGAGFSKLPDLKGNVLPGVKELCPEICNTFNVSNTYGNDLERISTIVNTKAKQQYQNYLREKFTVESSNELYDQICKSSINSFITTNIDNVAHHVMDKSKKYYFNSITSYGATKKSLSAIPYIPLHGDVLDVESHLYFGKFELATVDINNRDLFDIMYAKLTECPTLFIGYGFHDTGVERVIARVFEQKRQNIWIQCLSDNENIQLFRDVGCFVIEGDTKELLEWIRDNLEDDVKDALAKEMNLSSQYPIPTINQVPVVAAKDYFVNAEAHWYNIMYNHAYERTYVNDILEIHLEQKNVIFTGMSFSGKTSLLMQLALKSSAPTKLFVKELTSDMSKNIISNLSGEKATIFIDDFAEDIVAYSILANSTNIKTIACSDDYLFESSKHLIANVKYKKLDITEIDEGEAQSIYEKIPISNREDVFHYKQNSDEKFSMFEMLSSNVNGIIAEERVYSLIRKIVSTSKESFEIIALTSYLTTYRSMLSLDVLISYFGISDYSIIREKINHTNSLLREAQADYSLSVDDQDQDYFSLRSNLFSYYINKVLTYNYKDDYKNVIRKFIFNVSPYKVYKHYIFKRKAYDSELFYDLFGEDAHNIYERIYTYDKSAYTLQQWALYKSKLKDFPGAFADIDKALTDKPNNFSIKNSRAIILFEANKGKDSEIAISGMRESMDILSECYKSDKRKVYHAQKYAQFALFFSKRLCDKHYINQAITWIDEIIQKEDSTSRWTKRLYNELKNE